MNRILSGLAAAFLMLAGGSAAFAAAGVNDYVTAYRISTAYPNCLKFQTANAGGDTTNHTFLTCGGAVTCYGIGLGTGTNSLGTNLGGLAVITIVNSRLLGASTGPYIQFTDAGVNGVGGFAPDCPNTSDGIDPLNY